MKNKILGLILILLLSFTSISFAEDSSNNEDYEDTKDNIDLYIDNQLSKINIDEVEKYVKDDNSKFKKQKSRYESTCSELR